MNSIIVRVGILLCAISICLGVAAPPQHSTDELAKLFDRLGSSDLEVKNKASQGLLAYAMWWGRQDVEMMRKSLPVALSALGDSDPAVRVQAAGFFGLIPSIRSQESGRILAGMVGDVIDHFDDPNDLVRKSLVRSIAMLEPAPPAESVGPLLKVLAGDTNSGVRSLAVFGLMRVAPTSEEVAQTIAEVFHSVPIDVRREMIDNLAAAKPENPNPLIIDVLLEQLDETSLRLRKDTVRALGAIGPAATQAVGKLQGIAEAPDADEQLRNMAKTALRSIEGSAPTPNP